MKKKSSDVFVTVDHLGRELEELLWWIEEQEEDIEFNMDDLDNDNQFEVEGGGTVETGGSPKEST